MKEITQIPKIDHDELQKVFEEIHMARPPYVLDNMVVGSRFTNEQQYAQLVLELSIAYDNLRIAEKKTRLKEIEIEKLGDTEEDQLNKDIKQIELEQTRRAMMGKLREFKHLYNIYKQSPKYTREQINAAQEKEYKLRLETQAQQDINATGRISTSNQEGLRQIGHKMYPQLDRDQEVEKRFLAKGDKKDRILVGIPTEKKAVDGLPCIEGLNFPNGYEVKIFNSYGRLVADNYNNIVREALNDGVGYLVTVEDDTYPPEDAIIRLISLLKKNPKSAVGAWYPKKGDAREGVHVVLKNGERTQLPDDGEVHEVYTMAMGCSIYPIQMFMDIKAPWFKTTTHLSQDSYFSQLAREAGYKLLVDTNIKCKHQDRKTKHFYK